MNHGLRYSPFCAASLSSASKALDALGPEGGYNAARGAVGAGCGTRRSSAAVRDLTNVSLGSGRGGSGGVNIAWCSGRRSGRCSVRSGSRPEAVRSAAAVATGSTRGSCTCGSAPTPVPGGLVLASSGSASSRRLSSVAGCAAAADSTPSGNARGFNPWEYGAAGGGGSVAGGGADGDGGAARVVGGAAGGALQGAFADPTTFHEPSEPVLCAVADAVAEAPVSSCAAFAQGSRNSPAACHGSGSR